MSSMSLRDRNVVHICGLMVLTCPK